jgi:DNA-binding transcriptional LysR family regulator
MDEVDPGALGDVAYGIFEHLLHRELRETGRSLYRLVEDGIDFSDELARVLEAFRAEYPPLADALIERFDTADAIYAMIRAGEGVVPTKTTQMYWIVEDAPSAAPNAVDDELAGKWLVFLPAEEVDAAWRRIRDATAAGELGISAKVSTAKPNPGARDDRYVIYVYTADWRDEVEVMRVREALRALGVEDRIGYKRNLETFRGEYSKKGKRVTYYSA